MNTLPQTRRGVPIFKRSPFTDSMLVQTRTRSMTVARGTAILDADSGTTEGITTIAQVKEVDTESFVKIFSGSIRAYFDLSPAAQKIFYLLLSAVQNCPGADEVYIGPTLASEMAEGITGKPISASVYHRGMRELAAKRILAHSTKPGWVYINPAVIFNGDRARFLLDLRKTQGKPKDTSAPVLPVGLLDPTASAGKVCKPLLNQAAP